MMKFAKILIPALTLIALVVALAVFGSAADDNVVFVAAAGTGDGTGPANPIGNAASYVVDANNWNTKSYQGNALYRAFDYVAKNGKGAGDDWTIVLVGQVVIDSADSLRSSPAEFTLPAYAGKIVVTSVYGGKDYREDGAELMFDHTAYRSPNLLMQCASVWEQLNITYKYSPSATTNATYEKGPFFSCGGHETVFGEGINTISISFDGTKYADGASEYYPNIIAGKRYGALTANPNVTVRSGKWNVVSAGEHDINSASAANKGRITGNSTVTIEGGTINALYGNGAGAPNSVYAKIIGDSTLNVKGGTIGAIYGVASEGIAGILTIDVGEDAKVGSVAYKSERLSSSSADYAEPSSVSVKYNVNAISSENVTGFADGQVSSEGSLRQPTGVLYVAAEGKGKQDGSSPENAIGNDSGYDANYKWALKSTSNAEDKFIAQRYYKNNALYKALSYDDNAIVKNGGTIVVCGDLTINLNDSLAAKSSNGDFQWPAVGNETIVITGKDATENYGATLTIDRSGFGVSIAFKSPVVIENVNIEYKYNSAGGTASANQSILSFRHNKGVIGEGVNVTCNDVNSANVELYPVLVGGGRASSDKGDTDLTVKSGTWGWVYGGNFGITNAGAMEGNVNVNVDGGKILTLIGTCRETSSVNYTVTGDVNINVNGGEVTKLYGANHNGLGSDDNKIEVNVAKGSYVGLAWSFYHTEATADKQPKNSTLNYDRSAILEESIKYFETVNADGDGTPELPETVIFVANEGKGKQDGSSPENAIGHAAGYAENRAIAIAAGKKAAADRTDAEKNLIANIYKDNALYRALSYNGNALINYGGVIVVCDALAVDAADAMRASLSDFQWPAAGDQTITITSVYNGVDYRTSGAKFVIDKSEVGVAIQVKSPTVWDNINIEHKYDSAAGTASNTLGTLSFNQKKAVIGQNVTVTPVDVNDTPKELYPAITGGHRYLNQNGNTSVTVLSGKWSYVIGGNGGLYTGGKVYGNMTGDVEIIIGGDASVGYVIGTGAIYDGRFADMKFTGNVNIAVTGNAEVSARIYGANQGGITGDGKITVVVEKGTKVAGAWGYYYVEATARPDASITYDRTALYSDLVKYFTETIPTGEAPVVPDVAVYIANKAKGKGDGSSPENALGNADNYDEEYKKALDIVANVPSDDWTKEQTATVRNVYTLGALYRALENAELKTRGGYIVVVDEFAIDATNRMASGYGDVILPSAESAVVITSVYGGVDYRTLNGAKFILDARVVQPALFFSHPVTFENITIEHKYNSKNGITANNVSMMAFTGNKAVIGDGVDVVATDSNPDERIELYPALVGNHRYSESAAYKTRSTDLTVKSGTWGWVYGGNYGTTTLGAMEGNVNVTVEGGKIGTLVGTCRENSASVKYTVTGDVTINIKGGEVTKLYASNRVGVGSADNKIAVTIDEGAYVGLAWGFFYAKDSADNQPKNATIAYHRSSIFEEDIKYFATVEAYGEGEPGIHGPVIFVASTSRGKGDGSSPENAIGNDADYAAVYKQALAYMKKVDNAFNDLSTEEKAVVNTLYKKNALYKALAKNGNQIVNEGGTIVVVDRLAIDSADAMRRSFSEFRWPADGNKKILITSKYDGVDYRWKGARFVIDTSQVGVDIEVKSPTVWENITIEHRYNSANGTSVDLGGLISATGHPITMDWSVSVIPVDLNTDKQVELYPSIAGGGRYQDFKSDSNVTIKGGTWAMVVGGTWAGTHTGNTTVTISGGKVTTVCGTSKPTSATAAHIVNGYVRINLWGGEVDNVYGAGKAGLKGGIVVSIGANAHVNGKVYATHPDYAGNAVSAVAYYNINGINEDQLVGFTFATPQTGSPVAILAIVAIAAIIAASFVISKKRKKIED